MVMFLFVVSCFVFVTTITWMSYQLAEAKAMNPVSAGAIGFFLSLLPPIGLIFVAYLALKEEPRQY
ncbi:hypothetical protein [Glaciecola petra]|uniref:Uncharacterized protein n=1 Tax=Glaciecola petra TaxID=3075602 RepID=A0ABU2ZRB6_9ALTE|nr:hypothetical protein [Aestuariibacter sp. P117]MDT0594936.1 hypothetical protein [Aestuariibacter sp. P117]